MDPKCIKRLKPTFCHDWLENEKYKFWIKEVPHDDSLYFCAVCKKTFSCSSRVSRHAESDIHRNNMLKSEAESDFEETKTTIKESRKREFHHSWIENKQFKPWLKKIPNDPYNCFCSFCNSTFRCGLDALRRHSETRKHILEYQKKGPSVDSDTSDEKSIPTFEDRKKIAEIKFAALIAEKNIPFKVAETILSFFQNLGKEDPEILQNMTMNQKKGPEIINKILYVREQERIIQTLRNNKFSIFIGETSDISNDKWMTFLVRYVDLQTLNVRTELFKLIHLDAKDHSAEKLFTTFKDEMWEKQIPLQNILALSCDNVSVMTEKYDYFRIKLQKYCENLITIPSYHASALVVSAACKAIPEACEELLKKATLFISNPRHVCIFPQFQISLKFSANNKKNVKLSETQWLSHHSFIVTLNKNWNMLMKFLQKMKLRENSKSATALLVVMQNLEMRAYFLFLEYILDAFNKYNASFQGRKAKISLLQSAAEELLKTVLRNILKPSLLNFVESDIMNPLFMSNCQSPNEIIVGPACEDFLDDLSQEGQNEIVKSVYANCLSFYKIAVKEIREKLLVKEKFLDKLKVFEPRFALQQEDEKDNLNKSIQDVLFIAKRFSRFDEEILQKEWQSLHLDFILEQKQKIIDFDFDNAWKTIIATKDANGEFKYPILTKLINIIRSLPISNSDSERMFSLLTNVKTRKRNKLCPINVQALCVLKSSLRAREQTALTMTIDDRYLTLMSSQNLHQTNIKKEAADVYPSTSSNL